MADEGQQSSGLLYGALEPLRQPPGSRSGGTRLILVIELSDPQTGEIADMIEVDFSKAKIGPPEMRLLARGGWTSEWLSKDFQQLVLVDDGAREAWERIQASEHKWQKTRLDPESAIAWCAHRGIDLD